MLTVQESVLHPFWDGLSCKKQIFDDVVKHVRYLVDEYEIDVEDMERCYIRTTMLCLTQGTLDSWTRRERLLIFGGVMFSALDPGAFLCVLKPALRDPSYFHTELDIWHRPMLLHLLGELVGSGSRLNPYEQRSEWSGAVWALVTAGVAAGADLHSLSHLGGMDIGMTPLMHVLNGTLLRLLKKWSEKRQTEAMMTALRDWVSMLRDANVDLMEYGNREAGFFRRHWQTEESLFFRRYWPVDRHWWRRFDARDIGIYQITYGAMPSDWGLLTDHPGDAYAGEFWDILDHPERAIPGA